tara:strand:- start:156 stop:356 length:201 start_codon:yes stop_codon:yes gene_type:complete
MNSDFYDVDMRVYRISRLSYIFRVYDKAQILRERISICYNKEDAARKAIEVLRDFKREKDERAART